MFQADSGERTPSSLERRRGAVSDNVGVRRTRRWILKSESGQKEGCHRQLLIFWARLRLWPRPSLLGCCAPIAIGEVVYRLVGRALRSQLRGSTGDQLQWQFGAGFRVGREVVIHGTRALLTLDPSRGVVQVDIRNVHFQICPYPTRRRACSFNHIGPSRQPWIHRLIRARTYHLFPVAE